MKLGEPKKEPQKAFWALRFGFWIVIMIVGVFFYLHYNPILIANEPINFSSYEISRSLKTDVAIVVDYEAIRKSEELFSKKDWSAAWIDTFEQEIGPITVATPNSLTQSILERSRVLILTASVANSVPDPIIGKIRDRVRDGMIVVLERPSGKLRETFSADGRGGNRPATSISFGPSFGPNDVALKKIPLFGSFVASTGTREKSETFLAYNGAPTIYSIPIGDGFALTVEFEFGKQLVSLQQGIPNDDFTLDKKDDLRPFFRTEDLVANPSLIGESIPFADLLERTLVWKAIGGLTPLAAIWPFPKNADGVLVFLHDDQSLGKQAFWLSKLESENDAKSTYLFSYDALSEADFAKEKNEVGFLWKIGNDSSELQERMGVLGWNPLTRPMGIAAQHKTFLERSGTKRITTSATAESNWLDLWDEPFRQLASAKVRIDTSYEVEKTSGYHFGTGFPFLVLSRDGIPVGMREQPVVLPYGATRGPILKTLLEDSAQENHQAITSRIPANAFAGDIDPSAFKSWTQIFETARQHNHAMMSVGSYDIFLRARRVAEMRSRFKENVLLPSLPSLPGTELSDLEPKTVSRFRVTINAKRTDHAIVVPEMIGEKRAIAVREKSKRVEEREVSKALEYEHVQLMGTSLLRIPVPRGFSTVDVFYE